MRFATDNIIAHAIEGLESYKQGPRAFAALYAEKLYTKAQYCRIVYEGRKSSQYLSKDYTIRSAKICAFIWGSTTVLF